MRDKKREEGSPNAYHVTRIYRHQPSVRRWEEPIANGKTHPAPVRLGTVEELVGYHVRRVAHVFLTDFTESVAGSGLRQVLFGILSVTSANPGISQGKVGEALGIQRNNMATLANELEEMGFIHRVVVENNRRALSLTITPKGMASLNNCLGKIRDHEERLLSDLSSDERELLVNLLGRIQARSAS